jgi:hypothetical protein
MSALQLNQTLNMYREKNMKRTRKQPYVIDRGEEN